MVDFFLDTLELAGLGLELPEADI